MSQNSIEIAGLDALGPSADLEINGAWMDIPGSEGMAIRLRSQHSVKVREVGQRINRRHMPTFRAGKLVTPAELDKDKVEMLAQGVVSAWRGFKSLDGVDLPRTAENVRGVMTRYPWLRDLCMSFSDDRENYRPEQTDVEAEEPPMTADEESEALEGNSGR